MGRRLPRAARGSPGVIKPGTVYNDIISQEDWMPTLLAAAGEPDIVEKLKKGYTANGKKFKIHCDGYNFLPYFQGTAEKGPRQEIYYFSQAAARRTRTRPATRRAGTPGPNPNRKV